MALDGFFYFNFLVVFYEVNDYMREKKHFIPNSTYYTISVYVIITCIIVACFIKALFYWGSVSSFIHETMSVLKPFFYGILIAFLINPLISWLHNNFFTNVIKLKNYSLKKFFSIFTGYILVLSALILGIIYIIPEITTSLQSLVSKIPTWATDLQSYFRMLSNKYPNFDFAILETAIHNLEKTLNSSINGIVKNLTTAIVSTGIGVVKFVYNFIVSIVVSCYIIIDKKRQLRSMKRFLFAFFREDWAKKISRTSLTAIRVFGDFFDGKMIDSLIIGILCFVGMIILSFFNMPEFRSMALLISVVVGVTNMIPYFGPFIGAIPSILLMSFYSPKYGFIMMVWILILQQLDGNIIGPKILGDSTGIRPFWIIFAITIGGWSAGIIGMLLGVPFVAVCSKLLDDSINSRLYIKGIDMPAYSEESKFKIPRIIKSSTIYSFNAKANKTEKDKNEDLENKK